MGREYSMRASAQAVEWHVSSRAQPAQGAAATAAGCHCTRRQMWCRAVLKRSSVVYSTVYTQHRDLLHTARTGQEHC
jgi:hypothetical protein